MNFGAAPLGGPYSSSVNLIPTANPSPAAIAAAMGSVPAFPGWYYPFGNGIVYVFTRSTTWNPPLFIGGKQVVKCRARVFGGGGGGSSASGNGIAGGTSSFGSWLTATGGGGGTPSAGGGIGGVGSSTVNAMTYSGGNGGAPIGSSAATFYGSFNGASVGILSGRTGTPAVGQLIDGPGLPYKSTYITAISGPIISVWPEVTSFYGTLFGNYTCGTILTGTAGCGGGGVIQRSPCRGPYSPGHLRCLETPG